MFADVLLSNVLWVEIRCFSCHIEWEPSIHLLPFNPCTGSRGSPRAYPSWHWAKGRVHPGQVNRSLHGFCENLIPKFTVIPMSTYIWLYIGPNSSLCVWTESFVSRWKLACQFLASKKRTRLINSSFVISTWHDSGPVLAHPVMSSLQFYAAVGQIKKRSCACVLQSALTCLHPCADLTAAGSTHGVRQFAQYADTSCHGRGWKVWTNIACQSQKNREERGGGKNKKKKTKQLTSRSFGCADKQSHGASANEIWGAWAALPGEVTQGRERKGANWTAVSGAQVSAWPRHLWE